MISTTRPITESHKTVLAVKEKAFDKDSKGKANSYGDRLLNSGETTKVKTEILENRAISVDKLEKAVEETNRIVFPRDDRFEFKIHERTGRMMVKLVDKETEETIREIPSEKILDLIANIWEMVGILVDERG